MSAQRKAELRAKIERIDAALEALATGARVVKMSYDGQTAEYGQGDKDLLKELRSGAKRELDALSATPRRGSFRMVY